MSSIPQWRAWSYLFVLCLAVYGAAFAARQVFAPGIVPIAFAEEPQSSWAVQLAFLLRATEMIAGLSGILLLIAAFGVLASARTGKAAKRTPGP